MEQYNNTEGDVFYMGARTEWLPAEQFTNINNWDDSLKPSASHYIQQVEEWIALKKENAQEKEPRKVANEEHEKDVTKSVITKPTPNNDVDELSHLKCHSVGGAKSFECNQCGKKLASKQSLTWHLRVHSGEKPFSCSQCGKAFTQKGHLTTHLRVHSGEKPFACSQCGKAFARKSNLNRHVRVHSAEKLF